LSASKLRSFPAKHVEVGSAADFAVLSLDFVKTSPRVIGEVEPVCLRDFSKETVSLWRVRLAYL
jgi:hypothetical protein